MANSSVDLTHMSYVAILCPTRVEVEAAHTRSLPSSSHGSIGVSSIADEVKDPLIRFPLMSFWPMDLQSS